MDNNNPSQWITLTLASKSNPSSNPNTISGSVKNLLVFLIQPDWTFFVSIWIHLDKIGQELDQC